MKKLLAVAMFVAILAIGTIITAQAASSPAVVSSKIFPSNLKLGSTGDYVSDLQQILKSDSAIYPGGLVTGYFGKLTEEAVKKLQKKYGLSETGVVDDKTQEIIFPQTVEITVVAPNGGESWDKKDVHNILWKSTIGPVTTPGMMSPGLSGGGAESSIAPFFHRASIDLIKDSDASFRYHIATVSLYQSQYPWKISSNVTEGSDYRIRISAGGDVPCVYRMESKADGLMPYPCPLSMAYPSYSASDTSDKPFTVTGVTPPSPEVIAKLKAQVNQIENALNNLMRQVQELKSLIGSL